MKSRCCLALLWLAGGLLAGPRADAQALDSFISAPDLWQMPAADFVEQHSALGFYWLSQTRDRAESHTHGVTLFSQPVYETDAQFQGGKLSELAVSIYNRGDAGEMSNAQFHTLLQSCVTGLTGLTHAQPTVPEKEAADAVKAVAVVWQNAASRYTLEYSFTREVKTRNIPFRAEFVRLRIAPVRKATGFLAAALAGSSPARFDGPAHVKKLPNGDVLLETVPMVDQGQKGYCVVATAERVMRYYGVQADEHELAELANSSASTGTSTEAMLASLKKLGARLRVRIATVQEMDIHQILAMIAEYNRAARHKHLPEISTASHVLDMQAIYASMNAEVFRDIRTKNKSEVDRLMRQTQEHIDKGIPLLWRVVLGLVPEQKAPAGIGGHMRLIIGYNLGTDEILYSDSWGPGHELKRMPAADAWTMTTGVDTIEPL